MQMLNVVPFKISASSTISEALRILGMLNQNITNTLTHLMMMLNTIAWTSKILL